VSSQVENRNEDNVITSFDIKGIVHFEFISQVQTVNQTYYVEILKWMLEDVGRKRSELWPIDWISNVTMVQLTRRSLSSSSWPKNRLLE
jgi:hypothetical protein